jgi:hypothetical protein
MSQIEIQNSEPLPKNYVFLKKGNQYRTLNWLVTSSEQRPKLTPFPSSSKSTSKAGLALYIIKDKNTRIGIACPARIHAQVLAAERATRPAREQQAAARHARERDAAGAAVARRFPAMPPADAAALLRTAWKVGSGRVGRAGALDVAERVRRAAQAHARHRCTDYDARLARGEARQEAREATRKAVRARLREWEGAAAAVAEGEKEREDRREKDKWRLGPAGRKKVGVEEKRVKRARKMKGTPTKRKFARSLKKHTLQKHSRSKQPAFPSRK